MKSHGAMKEIVFLEAFYEWIDVGETTLNALIRSGKQAFGVTSDKRFWLLSRELLQIKQWGLSERDCFRLLRTSFQSLGLGDFWGHISSGITLGGYLPETIQEWIRFKVTSLMASVEKDIERAPLTLLLPLFCFTFLGTCCFMGVAMLVVMQGT